MSPFKLIMLEICMAPEKGSDFDWERKMETDVPMLRFIFSSPNTYSPFCCRYIFAEPVFASEEKEKQLSAAAHLSDFLNNAPQDDSRRTNAQTALEFLVKKYNLKSASKDRKKKG